MEKKRTKSEDQRQYGLTSISQYILQIFESFKSSRIPFEQIWQECWFNYLGQYQSDLNWKPKTEGKGRKSRIFIKLTSLKCNTAHSKIIDVYAGKGGIPFDTLPINMDALAAMGIDPAQARKIALQFKEKLKDHFRMIELEEIMDTATLEMAILGTAVLKGPIIETRHIPVVSQRMIGGVPVNKLDPKISPFELSNVEKTVPVIDHIPLWEYYVDANANSQKDSIGEIHFQRLLPADFRRLAYQGGYDKEAVREAARRATTNDENDKAYIQMGDNFMGRQGVKDERVSALEYQGLVPVAMLQEAGVEVPEGMDDEDDIESIVTLGADGIPLKVMVNPLGRRQFYVCPYKKRPHSIYGVGPAEAMRDSQKMVNSSARIFIDNKALSGNNMVGVNLDRIDVRKTKNLDVYAGKVWYIKGNFAPKDAIGAVGMPDISGGLREMIELFERFADEETGLPKYTSGEQSNFLNKTAHGISMLMGAANINLKTTLKNIDDFWIEPIVEAFADWFNFIDENGPAIPLKIKATGTDSLIAKELKMENYMKFLQITGQNKEDAIFMDRVKLMKNVAEILETTDVMRSDQEVEAIMKAMSEEGSKSKDLRELVDLDRLFPLISRSEQIQILKQLGITPSEEIAQASPAGTENPTGGPGIPPPGPPSQPGTSGPAAPPAGPPSPEGGPQ